MDIKKTKHQKFTVRAISREQIKNAEYNPRKITEEAKKKLKAGIQEHGLVAPIVWNERTGNIVGGHQRINAIDTLEKKKNYKIDVAVIDVDEKEEMKLNVKLNNSAMQGEFDWDLLNDLAETLSLDLVNDFGFDVADAEFITGDLDYAESCQGGLADLKEKNNAYQESISDKKKTKEDDRIGKADLCLTLVFNTVEQKRDFLKRSNQDIFSRHIAAHKVIENG